MEPEYGANQTPAGTSPSSMGQKTRLFTQVRNLPAVCIESGAELGIVSGFLIDPVKGLVVGLVLGAREIGKGVRVLPIGKVASFGSFALTV